MIIFVTGATGFIGSRLAWRLAEEGHTVHAIYRSENKATVIHHPNIRLFKGDILDPVSLEYAMAGCEQVYHTAAFAKVWDPSSYNIYRLNIVGTLNIIHTGLKLGINKFVCTSTAGVYGPSGEHGIVDENSPLPEKYFTDYESSKSILEKTLRTFIHTGIQIMIVNPSRVYGPGILSESNGVTRMIKSYMEGKWRIIPGNGKSTGNYVHVEDVVTGHILAMEKGKSGENYILGGSNVSYNNFFNILREISGKNFRLFHIPYPLMLSLSYLMMFLAITTGRDPMIVPALVKRFVKYWNLSSERARKELGYNPMDIEEGMADTVEWLKNQNG